MIKTSITALSLLLCAGMANAQGCPETVAGESMARMIGQAGGAANLHQLASAQRSESEYSQSKSQAKLFRTADLMKS